MWFMLFVVVLSENQINNVIGKKIFQISCDLEGSKSPLEQFLIECRKTKTKVITLTNNNRGKQCNEPIRIRSKYM